MTIDLRVHPRARRTSLESAGGVLKAAVTAPPEDGKANRAVIALLADEWQLPRSTFAVVKGAATRDKTLRVDGEPALLAQRIGDWMRGRD